MPPFLPPINYSLIFLKFNAMLNESKVNVSRNFRFVYPFLMNFCKGISTSNTLPSPPKTLENDDFVISTAYDLACLVSKLSNTDCSVFAHKLHNTPEGLIFLNYLNGING
jgi:hypothetical protein